MQSTAEGQRVALGRSYQICKNVLDWDEGFGESLASLDRKPGLVTCMSWQPQGLRFSFWLSFKLYNMQKSHVHLVWSPHALGPQSLHCDQAHDTSAFAVGEGHL